MPAISQSFRCFDEVARRGSVRKAADPLHLTAAAVNQQILNLEAVVGTPLFDRLPRGMQLTSAGEILIAAVRRSQRDFDNALSQIEDLRHLRRGHVNIGVSHSSAEYMIPDVIEAVQRSQPGLTFGVRSNNGETLLRWLANGEIDVAYCLRRTAPAGVVAVRSWPQRLGVVSAPGHPLIRHNQRLRLRDCLDYPLVLLSADMELRTLADRIDSRLQRLGRPLLETSSVAMVRRVVARGEALAFMIPENVAIDVDEGRLVWTWLEDAGASTHTCVFQRAGYTPAVAMQVSRRAFRPARRDPGEFRCQRAGAGSLTWAVRFVRPMITRHSRSRQPQTSRSAARNSYAALAPDARIRRIGTS